MNGSPALELRVRCAVDDVALSTLHARALVAEAVRQATDAACSWLHADFARTSPRSTVTPAA